MCQSNSDERRIARLIRRLQAGDPTVRDELIEYASARLRLLARRMLNDNPSLRRWEQSADLLQHALLRLYDALGAVEVKSAQHFLRLAAWHMRNALRDLARHYFGPHGLGAHHFSDNGTSTDGGVTGRLASDSDRPESLARWTEFHEAVQALTDDERTVVELLWFQGLRQSEAAGLLEVDVRTVRRRWQSARMRLSDALRGEMPE